MKKLKQKSNEPTCPECGAEYLDLESVDERVLSVGAIRALNAGTKYYCPRCGHNMKPKVAIENA